MSPIIPNWPVLIIVLILLFLLGLLAIISPITLIGLFVGWPRFFSSDVLSDESLPKKLRNAVYLLDNDLEKFKEQYRYAMLFTRGMGCLMLLMLLFVILVLILALTVG